MLALNKEAHHAKRHSGNDNDSHNGSRVGAYHLGHLGTETKRAKMVIFHKKMFGLLPRFIRQFTYRLSDGRSTSTKGGSMPYSEKQVVALQNAAQQFGILDGEIAGKLATDLGQSKRSVIAKIKSLGLPYAVASKPVKGTRATSKAEYVAAIAKALDADASELAGLEKATALALSGLLASIR